MVGRVVDFNGQGIDSCQVGETITDKQGEFELREKRYARFLLTEIFMMEAPPLSINESIQKDAYTQKTIHHFVPFGGGGTKGEVWDLGRVYLKTNNANFDETIEGSWSVGSSNNRDTLVLLRRGLKDSFHSFSYQMADHDFYEYQYAQRNETLTEDSISLHFKTGNLFELEQRSYLLKNIYYDSEKTLKETSVINGKYNLLDNTHIEFQSDSSNFNGKYEVIDFDYEYMRLVRLGLR